MFYIKLTQGWKSFLFIRTSWDNNRLKIINKLYNIPGTVYINTMKTMLPNINRNRVLRGLSDSLHCVCV